MDRRIVVAVDGPAGSGKSSVSREVALKTGLKYIDSGAIYRAITLYLINRDGAVTSLPEEGADFESISIRQEYTEDGSVKTYLNAADVSLDIRSEQITANIGAVSDNRSVRDYVTGLLREWASVESIIMDGRDIGTVVFPEADLKIYLDASVEERARRRLLEYEQMGKNLDENDIKNQIKLRDSQDKSRAYGALVRAADSVYLDTSDMTRDEVVNSIVAKVLGL